MQINKSILLSSIVSIIVLSGVALGIYFGVFYNPVDDNNGNNETIALTIIGNGNQENYTLEEVKALDSYTGYGGTKNSVGTLSNYDEYVGIPVLTLLTEIGGMTVDHILRVTAKDNYVADYTFSMVNGNVTTFDNSTGDDLGYNILTMVLIFENVEGEPVTDGPLKVAFLSPEGYLTESTLWAKFVVKMELLLV